ncbi:fructose-1,6-bisphosphatase [Leptotrichia sp. OH3620_COT-345]|uniref:fructose-1,6-bisphosphatase n=1 Tax=Leptotrichia sp. OH3620_COT-345 TaxID=2491048 RepID=UPI000F648DD0|nr:fructose-1,6-bisphosphatase [Leptotrichia sp. OH3620_COT-345]RRD40189.1 fructose-1,6-bisphosphatase [Leptotrichia sp. OH3620_COT-345]
MSELKYLKLLSKSFRNIAETSTEIINLEAILNLPKGTEHFLSDIHGEYEAFNHVLRNASGNIREEIEEIFGGTLTESEKKELATLIYYPKSKYNLIEEKYGDIDEWAKKVIFQLIEVCKKLSTKYSRSKVRKTIPKNFEYIIQELLYERKDEENKKDYINAIIDTIISINYAKEFIEAVSILIQRLAVDRLHIVGDIYDRGPAPHLIMDCLLEYHNVDIQWGNHDLLWIGAGMGNEACIANVVRICSRYNNNDILEEAYGINLLPLATFSMKNYGNDECVSFKTNDNSGESLVTQIHKAITIIQFKIEGKCSERNPDFEMKDRELLKMIQYEKGTVIIEGKEYPLNDTNFPTVNPADPFELTEEEREVMKKLKDSFMNSEKLQRHLNFLLNKGSMYLKYNSNLLYHGCIPMDKEGKLTEVKIKGKLYKGKSYLDKIESIIREEFFNKENNQRDKSNRDFIWYLWCNGNSPLFGKDIMKTFERYFIDNKKTHKENKNPYYTFINDEKVCKMILSEFGLDPENSHIINGHVPVKVKEGEVPVKANGKLFMIDGGFSKAYRKTTGIAGYTMIYNSYGIKIISLAPFESKEKAIKEGADILSSTIVFREMKEIIKVKDTDIGYEIQNQISELKKLLIAYRAGIIKQTGE